MHIWPMKKNKILYGLGQTKQKTFESGKNEIKKRNYKLNLALNRVKKKIKK